MSIFPTKILVATDSSDEAALAVKTALGLAKSTDSELHVVYVEPSAYAYQLTNWEAYDSDLPSRLEQATQEEGHRRLEEQVRKIREADQEEAQRRLDGQVRKIREAEGKVAGAHARVGYPEAEIVELAEELGAGLIVLGSRGLGGIRRALMGSVSDTVVRHAHCPVMVVRVQKERTPEHEAERNTSK